MPSSVLRAFAKRMPAIAHRKQDSVLERRRAAEIAVGDHISFIPHEIAPVDGTVIDGNGIMNEVLSSLASHSMIHESAWLCRYLWRD